MPFIDALLPANKHCRETLVYTKPDTEIYNPQPSRVVFAFIWKFSTSRNRIILRNRQCTRFLWTRGWGIQLNDLGVLPLQWQERFGLHRFLLHWNQTWHRRSRCGCRCHRRRRACSQIWRHRRRRTLIKISSCKHGRWWSTETSWIGQAWLDFLPHTFPTKEALPQHSFNSGNWFVGF